MKKIFTFFLALVASAGIVCASDTGVDGIWYIFDDTNHTAQVTYRGSSYLDYGGEYNGAVVIPSSVTYNNVTYSVTGIATSAFYGCSGLTSIEIPNSVTSIGTWAFNGCRSLTTVTLPNSVTDFAGAFYNCTGLTSVTLPNNITSIGNSAFYGCTALTSITIPNSVTSIGDRAFYQCTSLTSVTIPNNVTSIGANAFNNVPSIVYHGAAEGSPWGAKFVNGYVDGYLVYSDESKTELIACSSAAMSVTIPKSVTSIGSAAFSGCSNLNVVYIGNSVTSIGQNAFKGCSKLYKIIMLPNSVPSGINDAFSALSGRITYVGNTNYQSGYDVLGTQRVYSNLNSYFSVDGIVYALVNPSKRTCDIIDCDYSGATTQFSVGNSVVYRNITLSIDSININAFRNNPNMTKLTIDCSHSLPTYMASNCSNLTNVVINNSGHIGSYAFSSCSSIDTLIITSKGSIGSYAFSSCSKNADAYYNINNSGHISMQAFAYCDKLNTLIIGDSVKNIGYMAFYHCYNITNADIKNNGNIEMQAFNGSSTQNPATYVVRNIGQINDSAFANCTSMTNLTIDSCITNISSYAFQNCSKLEDVTIKNNGNIGVKAFESSSTQTPATYVLQNIGQVSDSAFANCTSMTNLTIDSCVTTIGQYAFQNCSGLEDVTIKNNGDIGVQAFKGSSTQNPATYTISNVGAISESAFENCTSMTNLAIDTCVTSIGQYAFQNCSGLEDVTINNKGNIGGSAFKGSSTLNSATYTISNVGAISESAFENCTSMTNLTIDSCVTTIGQYAFRQCTGLKNVTINNNGNIGNYAFEGCSTGNPATYIINNVDTLGNSAFANCTSLCKARLGNQISSINQSAFSGCVLLDSVTLPNTVTSLGSSAFYNCQNLVFVKLSSQLSSIGQSAFAHCTSLPELFIPKSVNSIGNGTFLECSALTIVGFEDGSTPLTLGRNANNQGMFYDSPLDSVYIGRELTYQKTEAYGYSPFYRSPSLRSIIISNFPTKVETNEFYGCTSLSSVYIGNGVQSIGDYAFSGCSSIEDFSFGGQVQTIGAEAFSDCVAMTRLYSYCQVPPTCGSSALADIDKWSCTLYVPKGTVSTYAEADQWMDFFFVEENEEGGDGTKYTISVDFDSSKGNVTGAGIYDRGAEAVLIATPAAGYVFVGWEDGCTNPERHISVFKSATYTATFSVPTDVDALDEEKESTGVMYDILGRPVSPPSHGIFIRNGEKILVK